ncbi:MAG: chemotaxis response regulator protein-glutamate methylesterase [Sphingomonas sp.]|nr:chemotaxis response regulator protein-glutamate methylesterase [Sphingomonas sp.]
MHANRPVRTLIVDDSASMRATLKRMLSADPGIEVIGAAPDPFEAREMIKALNPDVLTLDVEMPGMDGLSFLERIMRLRPMPVVMCSTLTARGAAVTIEALRLGAVDYVTKPSGTPEDIERDANLLCEKVKTAARSAARAGPVRIAPQPAVGGGGGEGRLIAIGASTGGVEALFSLLPALPADCPPVLIVQHMPAAFTKSFAERLNGECRVQVVEAQDGTPVTPGTVYIAPGGERHMELSGGVSDGRIRLRAGDMITGHRPSVDVLFRSLVPVASSVIAAILTGMGRDGADGMLALRNAGAHTLGQSQDSCVVWGMPRAAKEVGGVEREVGLLGMPEAILSACRARKLGSV